MSATALGLVLFAALRHALCNVVARRTGGDACIAAGVGALAPG